MNEPSSNLDRAMRIPAMVEAVDVYDGDGDWQATVADILTDLRHFCDCVGAEFEAALDRSAMHYEAEADGGAS